MQALIEWAKANPEAATALVVAFINAASYAVKGWPRAADVLASVVPHVGLLMDALAGKGPIAMQAASSKRKSNDKPGKPPASITMLALGALAAVLVVSCSGCASGTQALEQVAHASRDLATAAEPCLAGMAAAEAQACADDLCRADVRARWEPVAQALDTLHGLWCAVEPGAEGCGVSE